jgi:hypothetical protein
MKDARVAGEHLFISAGSARYTIGGTIEARTVNTPPYRRPHAAMNRGQCRNMSIACTNAGSRGPGGSAIEAI